MHSNYSENIKQELCPSHYSTFCLSHHRQLLRAYFVNTFNTFATIDILRLNIKINWSTIRKQIHFGLFKQRV